MNNREIKFKVYSFLDKGWIYFDVYDGVPGIDNGLSEPYQFTGLLDDNNVEIFDGDIIEYGESLKGENNRYFDRIVKSSVEFKNGKFGVETWSHFCDLCGIHRKIVIGNVIENKDLIKK